MKKMIAFVLMCSMMCMLAACSPQEEAEAPNLQKTETQEPGEIKGEQKPENDMPAGFQLITGAAFTMGSPESEAWRGADETVHEVTVSDFYMGVYEVTQKEYESAMGENPSSFSGENLPVENVSWMDAVKYCNARSEAEGLTLAYQIDGQNVNWNQGADGYRLPTEAEWEYACRAGTVTPFNTETSISTEEANYWGDYPYEIEDNYFTQENLETKPGIYRETTVEVGSFSPNSWNLYDMHGNVGEWVWDYYGDYDEGPQDNPAGPLEGTRKVNRGGGWNDFAKNLRSAYRAAMPAGNKSPSVGFRVARNVAAGTENVISSSGNTGDEPAETGNVLIAYFSWGGNTRGIAEKIQSQTGAELFEIELVEPYSSDYNTVLDQAQEDQNKQARPELANHIEDISQYDTIILGYPNWWASIPMPIASFLEEYDFSGKRILPFCSHGGGRFGQSLTAIAKLAPDSEIGEGLAVSYSGDAGLEEEISKWLQENKVGE